MTLRQLVAMVEARRQHDWAMTSGVIAATLNASRPLRKAGQFEPGDFDPTRKKGRGGTPMTFAAMKQMFVGKRKAKRGKGPSSD